MNERECAMNTFSDDTFNFFAAIRFNNNRQFFHENHDWYAQNVREPALHLASELAPVVADIDPHLIVLPNRVVCHINRDIRFSKDKSPYRDYLWLGFHRPGEEKNNTLGIYFDISDTYSSFGWGLYIQNKPYWNGVKRALEKDEDTFLQLLNRAETSFTAEIAAYKKNTAPEGMDERTKKWYMAKNFTMYQKIEDYNLLKSEQLGEYIAQHLQNAKGLYQWLNAVVPMEE